jgi:hypothetical protein
MFYLGQPGPTLTAVPSSPALSFLDDARFSVAPDDTSGGEFIPNRE